MQGLIDKIYPSEFWTQMRIGIYFKDLIEKLGYRPRTKPACICTDREWWGFRLFVDALQSVSHLSSHKQKLQERKVRSNYLLYFFLFFYCPAVFFNYWPVRLLLPWPQQQVLLENLKPSQNILLKTSTSITWCVNISHTSFRQSYSIWGNLPWTVTYLKFEDVACDFYDYRFIVTAPSKTSNWYGYTSHLQVPNVLGCYDI
jgi:hypothetical protein